MKTIEKAALVIASILLAVMVFGPFSSCSHEGSHGHGGGLAQLASGSAPSLRQSEVRAEAAHERLQQQEQELKESAEATIANTNWEELLSQAQELDE